jgi:lipid-binding SYLF domain-containing protein
MKLFLFMTLILTLFGCSAEQEQPSQEPPRERIRDRLAPVPTETLYESTVIMTELSNITVKGIPPALLADAQGIAIIPHVVKAGFVIAGSGGHGLVMARDKKGQWGNPVFLYFGGGSVGFQAGVESTDVVLVFRERKSLDRLLEGKGKITLGADATVAAGPVGRQAMAGTDAMLQAEIVSYSRSRGLFAGVALDGSVLHPDANSNALFGADTRAEVARQVEGLRVVLNVVSSTIPPLAPGVLLPPADPLKP